MIEYEMNRFEEVFIVTTGQIILIVTLVLMIAGIVVLYFLGKKAQKRKEEQDEQMAAVAQVIPMLIIDKKRMKIKESGLPQAVIDQTPKMMRWTKLPIVKAKVGPRIMTLIADESVFDMIPLKKEVKATVSGIYITKVKGVRGVLEKPQKLTWRAKLKKKYAELTKEAASDAKTADKKTSKKK